MKDDHMNLRFDGPLLRGWVYTSSNKCTNMKCRCHTDTSKRHGIYHRWTGKVNGKIITRSISKEASVECRRRIDNYHALMKRIEKLVDDEIAREPWKNIGTGT